MTCECGRNPDPGICESACIEASGHSHCACIHPPLGDVTDRHYSVDPDDDGRANRLAAENSVLRDERDALAQAIHEGRGILGFDNDGDTEPHTSNYIEYAAHWVRDAQSLRVDMDDLQREDEELLAEIQRIRDAEGDSNG